MSFTDQKPFVVTKEQLTQRWSGGKNGKYFRCCLCGYKFKEGDIARWQYTNDTKAWGNPLVCQQCDGTKEEIVMKWGKMHEESCDRMWWFCRSEDE